MNRPLPLLLLVVLAACSPEPASPPEARPAAEATPAPAAEPVERPSPPEPAARMGSRYTRFDLAACQVLREEREEGSFADYRCSGLPDVPLLVQEGDGRFDLDAGIDDDGFQTIGAFNDIGGTIEWRMRDGAPFAVIFRFLDRAMMDPGRTVLAVETVGRAGAPGCRVAQVAGDTPGANARARAFADRLADASPCPSEPIYLGNAR